MRRTLIALAVVVASVFTAAPANAAATLAYNAVDSEASLVVKNSAGTRGLLYPGQGSGSFNPTDYFVNVGWCTNLYDHNNGYRLISMGRYGTGEWRNFPWPGHTYTIIKYDC